MRWFTLHIFFTFHERGNCPLSAVDKPACSCGVVYVYLLAWLASFMMLVKLSKYSAPPSALRSLQSCEFAVFPYLPAWFLSSYC